MVRWVLAAVVLGATAAVPAAASASELAVRDGALVIAADSGWLDASVYGSGSGYEIYDYAGSLEPGEGCAEATPTATDILGGFLTGKYECAGSIVRLQVTGGESDDYIYADVNVPAQMDGGPGDDGLTAWLGGGEIRGGDGNDYLSGGDVPVHLYGGPGEDHLFGSSATDHLEGGADRDSLDGGAGSDHIDGGEGRDSVAYSRDQPVFVSLNGLADDGEAGERDLLLGIEDVAAGFESATITGDERPNRISSYEGNDHIDPGGGADEVDAGPGDDTVTARDGAVDDVRCGDGADTVRADLDDYVASDCETVERAAAPAPAPPPAPVTTTVTPLGLDVRARTRGRRVTITGTLRLPAGAKASCSGGGVVVTVTGAARRTRRIGTTLSSRCTFKMTLRRTGKRRVRARARFAGTPTLAPVSSR